MKSPTIPEIESQFEYEVVQQVIRCETPTLFAKRRSSTFEESLTVYPLVCRWLLDIISEDEHMIKESANFVLSENQLIRVVICTFDVLESKLQLSIEDEGCCGRCCNDSTQKLNMILIGNVNVLKLDVEKVLYGSTRYNTIDQIDAYSKIEGDALLLLKADKSKLIDAYSKTEADALLDDKL
ncbi:MAG: hypothetical protein EZS28_020531, partial [Streblomastix strix]